MRDFYAHFKKHHYTTTLSFFLLLTDVIVISGLIEIFYKFAPAILSLHWATFLLLSVILTLSWIISNLLVSAYQIDKLGTYKKIIKDFFKAGLIYTSISLLFLHMIDIKKGLTFSQEMVLSMYVTPVLPIILLRCLMLRFYRFYRNLPFNHVKAIIISC